MHNRPTLMFFLSCFLGAATLQAAVFAFIALPGLRLSTVLPLLVTWLGFSAGYATTCLAIFLVYLLRRGRKISDAYECLSTKTPWLWIYAAAILVFGGVLLGLAGRESGWLFTAEDLAIASGLSWFAATLMSHGIYGLVRSLGRK